MAQGEEGLGQLLVLRASRTEAKTRDDSRGIGGHEQAEALVAPQTVRPADVGITRQPSFAAALDVPDRYSRAIQSFEAAGVLSLSFSSV